VHTPPEDCPATARTIAPARRRPAWYRPAWYRAAAAAAGLAAAGLLVTGGITASAAPAPTISQVKAKLTQLSSQSDQLDEKLDQVQQELQSASQRLAVVNNQVTRFNKQFNTMQAQISRIAAQAYMQGSLNSSLVLLTSRNPQQVLNQTSILTELSSANAAEMSQYIAAARRLTGSRQAAEHTQQGIAQLKKSLGSQKSALGKLISKEQTLLAQLTPAQAAGVGPGGPAGPPVRYTGPTSTQAEQAVAFAYDQLNCPYVFGGTGPCQDGFDCSGLTSQAWAHAGVDIPRTSYEQWADLPHVSTSDLQPGDILVFDGAGHVGEYVGGGWLIDAPHSGADVERVQLAGWYLSNLDGAVRP
jgi:cell wall-associated NlpC family hydrolase